MHHDSGVARSRKHRQVHRLMCKALARVAEVVQKLYTALNSRATPDLGKSVTAPIGNTVQDAWKLVL